MHSIYKYVYIYIYITDIKFLQTAVPAIPICMCVYICIYLCVCVCVCIYLCVCIVVYIVFLSFFVCLGREMLALYFHHDKYKIWKSRMHSKVTFTLWCLNRHWCVCWYYRNETEQQDIYTTTSILKQFSKEILFIWDLCKDLAFKTLLSRCEARKSTELNYSMKASAFSMVSLASYAAVQGVFLWYRSWHQQVNPRNGCRGDKG